MDRSVVVSVPLRGTEIRLSNTLSASSRAARRRQARRSMSKSSSEEEPVSTIRSGPVPPSGDGPEPIIPDPNRDLPVPVDLRGTPFSSFKTGNVQANGLNFSYVEDGEGPLALCLHGWPDSPYTYRYLLPALARAGYRAVAPYLRGYFPSEVPSKPTTTRDLAEDVSALHQALNGDDKAVLIGHDWGAIASYGGAAAEPSEWRRVVVINTPPFGIFENLIFKYDIVNDQIQRGFHRWFHQQSISNTVIPLNDFTYINGIWADWSPDYDAAEDLPHAKDCMRLPGNLEATLDYFRTTFDYRKSWLPESAKVERETWGAPLPQPCLYLHGARDGLFRLTEADLEAFPHHLGPQSHTVMIPDTGHFLLVENPTVANKHIIDFITS